MSQLVELVLLPHERENEALIKQKAARQAGLALHQITHFEILKSSLDARSRQAVFRVRVEVFGPGEVFTPEPAILKGFRPVSGHKKVIIVGAGPAGYFAALELLELGIQPIVLDRGKDVQLRRRDLRAIQQFGEVNPHSNYCFGEGGAGTYSDGKLYTRSLKRGNVHKSLKLLVEHGAKSDILTEAHPHIGSNKLPSVVQNIRQTILQYGGEVHFDQCVTDLILKNGQILGVRTEPSPSYEPPSTVHPEPSPVHPEPLTAHREPSPVNREPSTVPREPCPVHRLPRQLRPTTASKLEGFRGSHSGI